MSASKFCRNFMTFPQGASENSCHATGEKQSQNNDLKIQETRDFRSVARASTEEQVYLDVPLVLVYFPESRKNHLDYCLRESTVHKNIIISQHRLSTALQKGDSANRSKRLNLNMGHRRNVEERDTNCSSDEAVRRVLRPSSRRASNDHGISSSLRGHVESMDTLKLPPGSTLVSDRGVFHTKDKDRPFACGYCGMNYKTKNHVYRHIMVKQSKVHKESMDTLKLPPDSTLVSDRGVFHTKDMERPFACGYCGKNYKRKIHVYRHIMQKHDEKDVTSHSLEKPFICDLCGMRFRLETDLCRHKFMHTEERLFPCKICNKSHTSKQELLRHSKVHKEEHYRESVICDICKKEFSDHYNLKEHMKIHTGGKPFKCSLCDKHFRVELHLQHHMITHRETWKLLLGDGRDSAGSRINVPVQFGPKICSKSDTSKGDLFSHSEIHKECESRKDVTCNICNKEFSDQFMLKEHMKIHTGEKPYKCSLCDRHFPVDIYLQIHLLSHSKNGKRLLGDAQYPEESTINVPIQLATSHQGIKQFVQDYSKAEENRPTAEEIVFSSTNATAVIEQLPENIGLVESSIHPFQLEHSQNQAIPILPTVPSGLATTHPDSALSCTNSRLVNAINGSSQHVYSKVVSGSKLAIVGERRTSTSTKRKSSPTEGKNFLTKAVNGKRISIASGIVYEDEVSSPEGSRCSTTTQTLLSSNDSETDEEVPAQSSCQANNIRGTSSSGFRHVKSMASLKLPPGSTLVSDRGVYRIKDKEKPFGCAFCGKTYKGKRAVYSHIKLQHDEKRFSCEFCGRSYGEQYCLADHMRIHSQEKPYTCDQCGKSFRCLGDLRCHKFTHTKERPFLCKICNKSYKRKVHLNIHSQIHNREECTTGVICNICKKRFRNPCHLKNHMTIHTGEKPFKCSSCDKEFRLKIQLQSHMNTHSRKKMFPDKKPCSVCGKSIAVRSMHEHMRMHSGEKPFECNICGKRFPRKSNLEGHLRSHTGEKPFGCGGCDKRFALYSNMMTHKAKCKKTSDNVTQM